jgi:hypothetical protein
MTGPIGFSVVAARKHLLREGYVFSSARRTERPERRGYGSPAAVGRSAAFGCIGPRIPRNRTV